MFNLIMNNNYKYSTMKTTCYAAIIALWLLASCRGGDSGFDATGVFETTEITVSAQGAGEISS